MLNWPPFRSAFAEPIMVSTAPVRGSMETIAPWLRLRPRLALTFAVTASCASFCRPMFRVVTTRSPPPWAALVPYCALS
jgi:hypothetical protein